jgi:hypothetical protein
MKIINFVYFLWLIDIKSVKSSSYDFCPKSNGV